MSVLIYVISACSEEILKRAENVPRDHLLTVGTCFGKFTKSGKFKLHVTALDLIAPYAKVGPRGLQASKFVH